MIRDDDRVNEGLPRHDLGSDFRPKPGEDQPPEPDVAKAEHGALDAVRRGNGRVGRTREQVEEMLRERDILLHKLARELTREQ